MEKFDSAEIRLHDPELIWVHLFNNPTYDSVDKNEYLATLKASRWYGPYNWSSGNWLYFITITKTGKNEYFVTLEMDLTDPVSQNATLYFYKGNLEIGK